MSDRCPRCDLPRANEADRQRWDEAWQAANGTVVERNAAADAVMRPGICFNLNCIPVDWRARALAAERAASPPQEVVKAARRIGELAAAATEGPWAEVVWYGTDEGGWAAVGPHHTGGSDECDDDASDNHERAKRDAAFIAECRTLAVVLAEFVRGGDK